MAIEVNHHGYLPVTHLSMLEHCCHTCVFPRVLIYECDAVIKIIQGEFIFEERFHMDDLGMFQHCI